jgi:4-amino-4-deoxy-L-arabinose transferase-like glycosyltransferase
VDRGRLTDTRAEVPPVARRPQLHFWAPVLAAAVTGLIVRLAYLSELRERPALGGDPFWYHGVANLVARGRGFVNPYQYADLGTIAETADHPPLLSVYLAGWSWFGFDSVDAHRLATALLGVATVVVGALAGRRIGGDRLGVVAGFLLAVYPNVWRHDGTVQAESLAVLATVVVVWLAYRYLAHPTLSGLVATSVAVALGALTRPELLLLSVLVVAPLALGRRDVDWAGRLKWLGAAALAAVIVLAPWVGFNIVRFGEPIALSSQLEVTLATANCEATYHTDLVGYWDLRCAEQIVGTDRVYELTTPEARRALRAATGEYVADHLDRVPAVVAARVGRITGIGHREHQIGIDWFVEGAPQQVARWSMNLLYPMMALAALGAVVLRRRSVPLYPVVGPIIMVLVTVVVLYAATRFRAPADAAMCLLAAAAIDRGVEWLGSRRAPAEA